jgi:hypothetical protein
MRAIEGQRPNLPVWRFGLEEALGHLQGSLLLQNEGEQNQLQCIPLYHPQCRETDLNCRLPDFQLWTGKATLVGRM